ncbi:hypothetical protein J3F80_003595 [Coemansia sp. RSA 2526]|nr:hypothetical protein J3F80_003595 [Coemansia sp. RSA 2526]
MDRPPSDIEVDLSSDAASEGHIGEAEASRLLQSSKVFDFGSAVANPRRMEFSPTPSPPPPHSQGFAQGQAQAPSNTHGFAQGQAQALGHAQGHAQPPTSQALAVAAYNGVAGGYDGSNISSSSLGSASYPAQVAAVGVAAGNGRDDASDAGSVKEGSVKEGSVESTAIPPASPAVGTPSARSRTSIWMHFTRDLDYATNRRGRCMYCHNYYSCSSGSTGNMWRHIKRSHPEKAIHGAPLATHGTHTTPLQPKSEPSAPDSRPRKRQASLSSPTTERFGVSPAHAHTQLVQSTQRAPSNAAHADDGVFGETSHSEGDSADGMVHALKLLLSLSGRAADRTAPPSSTLLSLLDQLHTLRSDSDASAAQRLLRHSQSTQRGSGGLATIPEAHGFGDYEGGLADASAAIAATRAGGPAAGADPGNINQFVAAISDALRTNAEAASGDAPGGRAQRALHAYVDFMVRDLVPVEKILSPGMQGLMSSMTRGAAAPTAAELMAEVFRRKDAAAQDLRRRLDAAGGKVSVSISTGRVAGTRHYLAVHAHWADSTLVRHDALLDWHCVDGAATSGDIIATFEGTLTRFDLFSRLGAVTTNYTREFVEFLNQVETICHARGASFDLDRSQATCVASTLLDVQTKLLSLLCEADAGAAAKGLTPLTKLRAALHSLLVVGSPGSQELVELCRSHGIELSSLEFDSTRAWDSTAAQLGSALAVYTELSAVMGGVAGHALAADEWLWLSQARALINVVGVAIDAMVRLPSDFPSIVDVVPIYDALVDNLQGLLQTPSLCDGIYRAGEVLREHLGQCHPFQASPIYRLAPLFDPRLKLAYYTDRGHDQAWMARVQRDAKALLAEHVQQPSATAESSGADGGIVFAQVPAGSDIKSTIDSFIHLGSTAAARQIAADGRARMFRRAYASGRTELDDYLAAPLAAPSTPALAWWHIHHAAFPTLARLAREYLAISASCCAISALFKRPNALDYAQVAMLDKKLADAYICLHHWHQ